MNLDAPSILNDHATFEEAFSAARFNGTVPRGKLKLERSREDEAAAAAEDGVDSVEANKTQRAQAHIATFKRSFHEALAAAAAAEDGVDSVGANKAQRAQARIAPFKPSFHETLGATQPGPVVFQDEQWKGLRSPDSRR